MKKQTRAIIMFAFMGGIMVTSGVVIAIPGIIPEGTDTMMTGDTVSSANKTQDPQFCGGDQARSTTYVQEYKIPSECTMPLAITVDDDGQVWFAQTNTGRLSKFNPLTEGFVEYTNDQWQSEVRSMMWGMDQDPDGNIWFTDAVHSSIWRFSTVTNSYDQYRFPTTSEQSLLQRVSVVDNRLLINDFQGGKLIVLNLGGSDGRLPYGEIPSPVPNSLTGAFDVDSNGNIWYTNWIYQQDGVLVKIDQQAELLASIQDDATPSDFIILYGLPPDLTAPNGLTVDGQNMIWIADTSTSYFFKFNQTSDVFTRYVTSEAPLSTYGNASGIVFSPTTRPYWTALDDQGRLVFNEQTGNRLAVFDPRDESLIEYLVPSKNPHWGDCGEMVDCGLAQVFGFALDGNRIWFTEWVENNIGVVDTSIPLPFRVDVQSDKILANAGERVEITAKITPAAAYAGDVEISLANPAPDDIRLSHGGYSADSGAVTVIVDIDDDAAGGTYKILVGAQNDEITISQYATVEVPPPV